MKANILIILGILAIGLFFFGCVSNIAVTEIGMNVTAKGTSEGIVLYFNNIPEDTIHLNVSLWDVAGNDYRKAFFDSAIVLEGNKLSELMETKTLLCPFVKNCHEYEIVITFWYADWDTEQYKGDTRFIVNAVAGGGISPVNDPFLYFNDQNNALVLSARPVFYEGIAFSQESSLFFYFCMGIEDNKKKGDDRIYYGGFTANTNELICDVSDIYDIYNEAKKELGMTGNEGLVIAGIVGCYVNYGNFRWEVGITKTTEVTVSL